MCRNLRAVQSDVVLKHAIRSSDRLLCSVYVSSYIPSKKFCTIECSGNGYILSSPGIVVFNVHIE